MVEPCIFDNGTEDPTVFDIVFQRGRRFHYTLSVLSNTVTSEILTADDGLLFRRGSGTEPDDLTFGDSVPEGDRDKIRFAYGMTSPFTLLLSKCSESRIETTHDPFEWFRTGLCFGTSDDATVIERAMDVDRDMFLSMLRHGDTEISDVSFGDPNPALDSILSSGRPVLHGRRILLEHRLNEGRGTYRFCAEDESSGTVRMMFLSAYLVCAIRNGGTLVVDELERSLYPMLVDYLVGLVQDRDSNPFGAQLLFTTHDTGIVRRNGLGRDQIWIASRNPSVGITVIYPFTNFDDDTDFETLYMDSRLGGVPRIRSGLRW